MACYVMWPGGGGTSQQESEGDWWEETEEEEDQEGGGQGASQEEKRYQATWYSLVTRIINNIHFIHNFICLCTYETQLHEKKIYIYVMTKDVNP